MTSLEVSYSRALSCGGKKYENYLYDRNLRVGLDDPCGPFQLILFQDSVILLLLKGAGELKQKNYILVNKSIT